MNSKPIRVLVVEPHTQDGDALLARIDEIEGIEVVGVAQSRRAAIQQAENSQPDVLLVDLMLPGYGSTQVVETVINTHPHIHILALSPPGDPPYDRIILALQAGALGYVCRDAQLSELAAAIRSVHQGDVWLPPDTTYEVLKDVAPELAVSNQERRGRLIGVLLGLVPLTGLMAAVTAYFWRQYWGQIGVRVVDLGVDPTTRVTDVIVFSLILLGVFGPLLFVDGWLHAIGGWVAQRPGLSNAIAKAHTIRLGKLAIGRLIFNRLTAWVVLALLVLCTTLLLVFFAEPIVIVFLGPAVAIILLVNVVGLDDQLPEALHLSQLDGRVLVTLGVCLLVFFGCADRRSPDGGPRSADRWAARGAGPPGPGAERPPGGGF